MSETEKRPYTFMRHIADCLVVKLSPACHRIEIAGSLRRGKEMIGDIELVVIPRLYTDLFGTAMPDGPSEVDRLLLDWPIALTCNGARQKTFTFAWQAGCIIKVDLFLQPDPATWGVNYLIRTGSAAFVQGMMTRKPPGLTVAKARLSHYGQLLDTPEEQDVFAAWSMPYVEPRERAG